MIIIAAADDEYGILFNNRRVSKDRILREKIIEITKDSGLFMNKYSYGQFCEDTKENKDIYVYENFLDIAEKGDFCFIENEDIKPYLEKIERIILFRWNCIYPSDFKFPYEILENYIMQVEEKFKGNSHEKISMEIYYPI